MFSIVAKLGGRDAAYEVMTRAGYRGGPAALRMMISRGRLSAEAMRALMVAADQADIPYCAADFAPLPARRSDAA